MFLKFRFLGSIKILHIFIKCVINENIKNFVVISWQRYFNVLEISFFGWVYYSNHKELKVISLGHNSHISSYSEINSLFNPNHEETVSFHKTTLQYETLFLLPFLHLDPPEPNSINTVLLFEQIQEPFSKLANNHLIFNIKIFHSLQPHLFI